VILLLTTLHIIICIALIIVVLLQSSKGEGLASGTFGGGGITGAVFGGRGAATFLSKATTVLAIAFFLSCMVLTFTTSTSRGTKAPKSEIQKAAEQSQQTAPPTTTVPGEQSNQPSGEKSPFKQKAPEKK
jgi:preprotein translocase subunit SecG